MSYRTTRAFERRPTSPDIEFLFWARDFVASMSVRQNVANGVPEGYPLGWKRGVQAVAHSLDYMARH